MSYSRRAPDPFPGAKQIRAKPLNRWNPVPVTRDPEKLPARLPASREFAAAPLSLNLALMRRPLSPPSTNRHSADARVSLASLFVLNVGIAFLSFHRDLRRCSLHLALVICPAELQRPALRRHREEG